MARVEGFEPSARWFGSSRSANWNYTRMYLRTLDGTRTRSICRERAVSLAIPPRGRIQITISGIDIHVKVFNVRARCNHIIEWGRSQGEH